MPFLIPILLLFTGAGAGAFLGAQVDDKLEPATPQDPIALSPTKIAFYAAMGMGLFWLAHKTKILK